MFKKKSVILMRSILLIVQIFWGWAFAENISNIDLSFTYSILHHYEPIKNFLNNFNKDLTIPNLISLHPMVAEKKHWQTCMPPLCSHCMQTAD